MAAAPDTAIVRARGDLEDSEEEQDEVIAVDGVHTGAGRLLRAAEAAGEECHTAQHRVRPLKGQYPISTVSEFRGSQTELEGVFGTPLTAGP